MRLLLVLLLVAAVALFVTNPDEDDFEAFVEDVVSEQVEGAAGLATGGVLGGVLGEVGGMLTGRLARRYADRDNYGLFSVYTLDFDGRARDEEEWRFLGIGSVFVELERPASLEDGE